jgi:hypothetical protein
MYLANMYFLESVRYKVFENFYSISKAFKRMNSTSLVQMCDIYSERMRDLTIFICLGRQTKQKLVAKLCYSSGCYLLTPLGRRVYTLALEARGLELKSQFRQHFYIFFKPNKH